MYCYVAILTMTSRLAEDDDSTDRIQISVQEICFQNIFLSVWINCQRKKICGIVHENADMKYIPGKTYTVTLMDLLSQIM